MVDHYGSQCGYCTPGFVMSLFEGYYRPGCKGSREISDQLCGNLCRCTGYRPIRDAALDLLGRRDGAAPDAFSERLKAPVHVPGTLDYRAGADRFLRPTSLGALFEAMASDPKATLVAGATEIGVDVTKKLKAFPFLISTDGVPELTRITRSDTHWRIGASAPLTAVEDAVADEYPSLAKMRIRGFRREADPQPGDPWREPRHSFADRRRSTGSPFPGRGTRARLARRRKDRGPGRLLHGLQEDRSRPGRDHPRGPDSASGGLKGRLAAIGLPQGLEAPRARHQHSGRGVLGRHRRDRGRASRPHRVRRRRRHPRPRPQGRGGPGGPDDFRRRIGCCPDPWR